MTAVQREVRGHLRCGPACNIGQIPPQSRVLLNRLAFVGHRHRATVAVAVHRMGAEFLLNVEFVTCAMPSPRTLSGVALQCSAIQQETADVAQQCEPTAFRRPRHKNSRFSRSLSSLRAATFCRRGETLSRYAKLRR